MLKKDKPKKIYQINYAKNDEYLNSNLLNYSYQLYCYHDEPSKTEKILIDIINDAKQVYLEEESYD